jgi:hypothetical protein
MDRFATPISAIALAFALLAAPAAALANVPTREGNIWDWRDHQPTETPVQRSEEAAGIAPTPAQRDAAAATVDELNRQLLQDSPS